MDPRRVCQICGTLAKPKQAILHAHYGAISCMGCKAFFRRLMKDEKIDIEKLECKNEDKCDQQANSNLSKCRKCRYTKCIKLGMKPHLVPDKEESKKFSFPRKQPRDCFANPEQILANFDIATEEMMRISGVKELIEQVIEVHMSSILTYERVQKLLQVTAYHRLLIEKFSIIMSPCFAKLDKSDKALLLDQNGGLYVQFIMAQYLSSSNGYEQLCWLLGSNLPKLCLADIKVIMHIKFKDSHPFLPAWDIFMKWEKWCQMEKGSFEIPHNYVGLAAYHMLFSISHWPNETKERLKNQSKIHSMEKASSNMLKSVCHLGPHELSNLMKKFNKIAVSPPEQTKIHNLKKCQLCPVELQWIEEKSNLFAIVRKDVPVPQEFISAYLSLSQQFSQSAKESVVLYGLQVVSQRCLLMAKTLAQELHQTDFALNSINNLPAAVMLVFLKGFNISSGLEQLKYVSGIDVEDSNLPLYQMYEAKQEDLHEICPVGMQHEFELQQRLAKKLQDFVFNDDVFILALFLVMISSQSQTEDMHKFIRLMLLKKLQEISTGDPEVLLYNFLADLREYSALTQQVVKMSE